ncbi:MAG: hypothetical protein JSR70_11300 [Proteobacteria bacterium]|nr:hypothetical protein [Pseudomonadota bacterium]
MGNDASDSNVSPFDWVQFPEGRARFAGTFRCWDETGRKAFALELQGNEYFGEIQRAFLPNGNDYNIEIVSFGYGAGNCVGMQMVGTCRVFTITEIEIIQTMIIELVAAGKRFPDPPSLLDQYADAHFMGEVIFRDGWILASEVEAA